MGRFAVKSKMTSFGGLDSLKRFLKSSSCKRRAVGDKTSKRGEAPGNNPIRLSVGLAVVVALAWYQGT